MPPALLITQCLQNDFVKPIGKYDPLPNTLHIGYEEARRLLGERPAEGPVARVMQWACAQPDSVLRLIHIRDWHRPNDPNQASHLRQFGDHCIRGTEGARFAFEEPPGAAKQTVVVDSLTLNDFVGTTLEAHLAPFVGAKTRVGLMGVWTEAKVTFLAYDLRARYPELEIGVCSALTASSSRAHHFQALDQLERLLGVKIFPAVGEFVRFLGGEGGDVPLPIPQASGHPRITIEGGVKLQEADRSLLCYLFRDSREARFRCLDGGFSGNVVLGTQSTDLYGHPQVPYVVKIGPQAMIGKERASFERVESVLGNNAPQISDFADLRDRGAIKYRYAAMGGGFSTTFQKRYMAGLEREKVRRYLTSVFVDQLGRFYQAAQHEKCNLLEYYAFSPQWAGSVRRKVEEVVQENDPALLHFPGGRTCRHPALFYEENVGRLLKMSAGSAWFSYVHGDLNGANIIVDAQENVWLIDFFHTHRGHVLKDLLKLENDLLYIFTPVRDEADLECGLALTDALLDIEDLAGAVSSESLHSRPGDATPSRTLPAPFSRAWDTIGILRSFYPDLIKSDRDPLQAWIAQMRYAVHTLGFDESSLLQKRWALYTAGRCSERIVEKIRHRGPLRVDWVDQRFTAPGLLGLTILPGRRDWGRDFAADLAALRGHGVSHVLCLLARDEFARYGVDLLLDEYRRMGWNLHHLPIVDQRVCSVEEARAAAEWAGGALAGGGRVLIHCAGGLGRSGMLAACILRALGRTADEAIAEVRCARSVRAIETEEQEDVVRSF